MDLRQDLVQVAVRTSGAGQQHHVHAVGQGKSPSGLAEQTLRPVALDGTADTTRRDDRDARPTTTLGPVTYVEHDEIAGTLPATPEHRADVAPVPEPIVGRRAHAVRPRAWNDRDDDAG